MQRKYSARLTPAYGTISWTSVYKEQERNFLQSVLATNGPLYTEI